MNVQLFRMRGRPASVSEAKPNTEDHQAVAIVSSCRICWDTGDDDDPLVAPCKCKGSMR